MTRARGCAPVNEQEQLLTTSCGKAGGKNVTRLHGALYFTAAPVITSYLHLACPAVSKTCAELGNNPDRLTLPGTLLPKPPWLIKNPPLGQPEP